MTQRRGAARRRLAWLGLAAALLGALFAGAAPTSAMARCGPSADEAPRFATDHKLRTAVLCLVNQARDRHRVRPLSFNEALRKSATSHSRAMVKKRLFSHYGPNGSTVLTRAARSGYLSRAATYRLAENIAAGAGPAWGSPLAIVRGWMHSSGHRENILDPHMHDFGAGVARGDPFGRRGRAATYTLVLGARG
jgi:uncharacterized protein YkwD